MAPPVGPVGPYGSNLTYLTVPGKERTGQQGLHEGDGAAGDGDVEAGRLAQHLFEDRQRPGLVADDGERRTGLGDHEAELSRQRGVDSADLRGARLGCGVVDAGEDGRFRISGLIDFGDILVGPIVVLLFIVVVAIVVVIVVRFRRRFTRRRIRRRFWK